MISVLLSLITWLLIQPYVTETHVKPGIMEHLEQLTSQFMITQKEFIAYKRRLNVVRTDKEQHHIEGKNKAQNWTYLKLVQNSDLNFYMKSQLNLTLVNISDTAPWLAAIGFLDIFHRPVFYLKTAFQRMSLSPSSGKGLFSSHNIQTYESCLESYLRGALNETSDEKEMLYTKIHLHLICFSSYSFILHPIACITKYG
jgi:hypothetical protein